MLGLPALVLSLRDPADLDEPIGALERQSSDLSLAPRGLKGRQGAAVFGNRLSELHVVVGQKCLASVDPIASSHHHSGDYPGR